jgi:hypothetical protein
MSVIALPLYYCSDWDTILVCPSFISMTHGYNQTFFHCLFTQVLSMVYYVPSSNAYGLTLLSTGCYLLGVLFITSIQSNSCTAVTCPTHLILLDLATPKISGKYKHKVPHCACFLQPPAISTVLDPNVFLRILFSYTLKTIFFTEGKTQSLTPQYINRFWPKWQQECQEFNLFLTSSGM